MAGRGNILEKLKRRKAQEEAAKKLSEQTELLQQETGCEVAKEVSITGRGRASLLDKIRKPSVIETSDIISTTASGISTTSTSSGAGQSRGRGSSLLSLISKTRPKVSEEYESSGESTGVIGKLSSLSLEHSQSVSFTSSSEPEPVCRQGGSGHKVRLTANYINLKIIEDKGMFQYEVKYSPDIDSRSLRFNLLNQHLAALGNVKNFDGTLLYLPIKLPADVTPLESIHPIDNSVVKLRIIFKKRQLMKDNIAFFNNLMNRVLKALALVRIGRHDFNPTCAHAIPQHRLEVWPGYITAINELEGGLQLNIDATHRVMRLDTVRDLMTDMFRKDSRCAKELIINEVIGTAVLTRYNNKTYKIDDIAWDQTPKFEFDRKGETITLIDYYRQHYGLQIKDLEQPLLVHRSKEKRTTGETVEKISLLVPELCFLAGITDSIRKDFKITRDLATVTKVSPQDRREVIRNFVQQVQKNEVTRKILLDWGLELENDTVEIAGRTLDPEDIIFGRQKIIKSDKAEWQREIGRNHVLRTPNMMNWAVIYSERDRKVTDDFLETMRKVCGNIGMKIGDPKKIPLRNDKTENYTEEIRKVVDPSLNMIVIIFSTQRQDKYSAVKKLCCVDKVCPSQVIIAKTLSRPDKLKGIVEKIVLQINCKIGGALWSVKNPYSNSMIVGIDVYHAGPGTGSKGSVAAFIASLDKELSQWHSRVCLQGPHQELVDLLKQCFISAIDTYRQRNSQYPDRIVIYRDGVGDGQLDMVRDYEVKQFLESCTMIDVNYKPKLSVIIVQKRVNTRIFEKTNNKLFNPAPGTIVDSVVTRRYLYDFYLVPQFVREGTVTPTHYIVIYDGADIKTDHMQRFTFKLCHLYYNWPGTIRVPAPCQYAHKLAYLVGQNIKTEPSSQLGNLLYYL